MRLREGLIKRKYPHMLKSRKKYRLDKDSVILLEQIRTLDKTTKRKLTYLSDEKMQEVDEALDISLGLHDEVKTQNT